VPLRERSVSPPRQRLASPGRPPAGLPFEFDAQQQQQQLRRELSRRSTSGDLRFG
jgi:hypothetical protein